MSTFTGKLRVVVHKTDDDDFEELCGQRSHFFEGFITDIDLGEPDVIAHELDCIGLYCLEDQIKEILKNYELESVIEIYGDVEVNFTVSGGFYKEYDSDMHFTTYKERKLTETEAKAFFEAEGLAESMEI